MKKSKRRAETEAVRGGTDLTKKNGPVSTPIYQTSTFEATDMEEQVRATYTDRFYTRYGNPTHTVAEKAIADLEGADAALLFSSGMSAITTTILSLLKSGDHIVAQRDIYGGATKFLTQWLPKFGVEVTLVDTTDYQQHEAAFRPNTRLLYLESPTNPTLRVVDLKRVAALAQKHSIVTLVDSTFSTPINCRPAEHGIDLIMHSGTKYFGGHADIICGIIAGRRGPGAGNPRDAHHARMQHGPARGLAVAARNQDTGRARPSTERERTARSTVPQEAIRKFAA